jgi:hypothetical protein
MSKGIGPTNGTAVSGGSVRCPNSLFEKNPKTNCNYSFAHADLPEWSIKTCFDTSSMNLVRSADKRFDMLQKDGPKLTSGL